MFYSDNHVEVNLDAFLASEEYAKESIKDLKLNQGSVFDKNAAGFTYHSRKRRAGSVILCSLFL